MAPIDLDTARRLDRDDPLRSFRDRFHIPPGPDGRDSVYLCGNSLGLQPRGTRQAMLDELDDWARLGVEGHFDGRQPWYSYHEQVAEAAAHVVGATPEEVVMMNGLTTNLHLLMVSFYRPTADRFRIVTEAGAFPSDRYAVASQARFHGYDPDDAIVELAPRDGETALRTDDIVAWLDEHGADVALVMLGGVNYYTGQAFDLRAITEAGHRAGAVVGFDLAHAAGNLLLNLHDDGPDFAAWCSYKYLNSGPGSVAGAFVHERHAFAPDLPRFAGWWGNDPKTRFTMPETFVPQRGAAGWQLSNAPVFTTAPFRVSGAMFVEATMPALRAKSERLTGALLDLVDALPEGSVEVITPRDVAQRGCQLSLHVHGDAKRLQAMLQSEGFVADFRPPSVVRVAPVPMYNTFEDVWRLADLLRRVVTGAPTGADA